MKKRQILSAVMGGVFMLSGISGILPLCTCSDAASSADMDIQDFPLSDVAMLDSYSTNAFSKELEYLLSFDTNRLLAGFRENAGMNTFGAKRYGGRIQILQVTLSVTISRLLLRHIRIRRSPKNSAVNCMERSLLSLTE